MADLDEPGGRSLVDAVMTFQVVSCNPFHLTSTGFAFGGYSPEECSLPCACDPDNWPTAELTA
jgi:hypothetical protein